MRVDERIGLKSQVSAVHLELVGVVVEALEGGHEIFVRRAEGGDC